jgi:hypothetical protein
MAWSYVGVSSVASANGGNITLTEPSGVQEGDLLVCVISYRSNAAFSSPGAPWVSVTSRNTGNTTANSTASVGSGHMFYCIRGSSAPGLTFSRTAGDIALGRIVAYRGNDRTSSVLVTQTSTTLAVAATAVSVAGLTTANARDLVVFGFCAARNSSGTNFNAATDPATASGTGADQTADPIEGTWQERADSGTTTGADCALHIGDAIRATAGATGDLSRTASSSARHVVVAAAFMEGAPVALTATGIATGAPTVGTPAITQAHALTAAGIATGAPTVGTPAITQAHALTATGIATGAPTVGSPAITQVHSLTATGIATGAPTVGTPAITQVHVLAADGIATGAPTVGAPAITQAHALTATGIATGAPTVGAPALSETDTVDDLTATGISTGAPTVGTPALTQVHALAADGIATGAPTVGNPALGGVSIAIVEQPSAGGSWAWLDAFSRRRQEAPTEEPKPKRKKRKRVKADTIDLAPDGPVDVQTGIVEAVPAWDVLAELQRIQNEAAEARRQRLRAIALADDEWLMMQ